MTHWGLARIESAGDYTLAVAVGGRMAHLARVVSPAPISIIEMLPAWDTWCERIDEGVQALEDADWFPEDSVTFSAPIVDPPTIYACGANYYDHVEEMGALHGRTTIPDKETESVFHFQLSSAALNGHRSPVRRPVGCTMLDYEVELAAIIGQVAENVGTDEALSYVAAYTVANDVSLRDPAHLHPIFGANFTMAKSQTSMQPMGPVLVPARFIPDPGNLRLTMTVNGEPRQNGTTANMIWSLPEQISALSSMIALQPGDIIMTGTPAGTAAAYGAYLSDGDVLEATVEGVATLTNWIAPART